MKEVVVRNDSFHDIVGNVRIDILDKNRKVVDRIEKRNHVFKESFKFSNYSNILSSTSRPVVFFTDDGTAPEDRFPFVRGNIVGWGVRGQTIPMNIRQAAHLSFDAAGLPASWSNRPTDDGRGVGWRWGFEFSPGAIAQIGPRNLRCIGITPQYRPFIQNAVTITDMFCLRSSRERVLSGPWPAIPNAVLNTSAVVRGHFRYSIHSVSANDNAAVTVTRYNMLTGEMASRDVTGFFGGLGGSQNRAVGCGFSADGDQRMYLMMVSGTAGNRRLMEFANDSFVLPTRTVNISAITSHPDSNIFAVRGSRIFERAGTLGQVRSCNFENNTNWVTEMTLSSCPYNGGIFAGRNGIRYMTMIGPHLITTGLADTHSSSPPTVFTTTGVDSRCGIFNVDTNQQVASIAPLGSSLATANATHPSLGPTFDPTLEGTMLMAVQSQLGANFMEHVATTALAAFIIPGGNGLDVPLGNAVQIFYGLEVRFHE